MRFDQRCILGQAVQASQRAIGEALCRHGAARGGLPDEAPPLRRRGPPPSVLQRNEAVAPDPDIGHGRHRLVLMPSGLNADSIGRDAAPPPLARMRHRRVRDIVEIECMGSGAVRHCG